MAAPQVGAFALSSGCLPALLAPSLLACHQRTAMGDAAGGRARTN